MKIREVVLLHICATFNAQYKEMVTPIAHLALVLHPYYRQAADFSKKDFGFYQGVAPSLMRKFRKADPLYISRLANQLRDYIGFSKDLACLSCL